ncbi:MAG: GNAT family N-acetyltransferase [Candidatus Bathyarchaeota archaeon]|nr:GNAT family N-acetyltransferase [Candidatus Termiticorpusculum sp.]
MLQVRVMSVKDYVFAVDLANTMGWAMELADFRFNQFLEPEGCFVLFNGSVPVGVATCISFGNVGWFGNLVVKPEYRGCGGGRLLLDYAVRYLWSRGVKSVGLYTYPCFRDFYGKVGFKVDMDLVVMQCSQLQSCDFGSFGFESCFDFSLLASFDRRFFGADRSRLLRGILQGEGNLCYVSMDGDNVVGYVLAKIYDGVVEVGPLVCSVDRSEVVFGLLKAVLGRLVGRSVLLYLHQNQFCLEEFLLGVGFRKSFFLSRMFLGESKVQAGVCLAESLERG